MHIAVDVLGLPHAMFVSTANATDRNGAISMLGYAAPCLSLCQKVLLEGGYTGANFANSVKQLIGSAVEVVKRNEAHKFAVLPKRWIVERSFAWLEDYRLLWKNCSLQDTKYLAGYKNGLYFLALKKILDRL